MVNTQLEDLTIGPISAESQNNTSLSCAKMLLESNQEAMMESESISLTTSSSDNDEDDNDAEKEDESEVIQLQYDDDDLDGYYMSGDEEQDAIEGMLTDRPGFKRMDLKGESESDKDLIIYSLNESLQIHKEIVERIQNEKDDLEYQHELDKALEEKKIERERAKREHETKISSEKLGRLESLYQSLLKELDAKKLDYRRMESRFHSHVKNICNPTDQISIEQQLRNLLQKVSDLCLPLSDTATASTLDHFFEQWPEMMEHAFGVEELDSTTISLLTEKLLWDTIMQDILQTSIHPGVSLNSAFGKIHSWVDKRNASWAARMKQQISSFVVKQSSEQAEAIEATLSHIIQTKSNQLCQIYNIQDVEQQKRIGQKWSHIVRDAAKLNMALKCNEYPNIDILHVEEGSLYNNSIMTSPREGELVAFVVSPPFMSSPSGDDQGFVISGKVYAI